MTALSLVSFLFQPFSPSVLLLYTFYLFFLPLSDLQVVRVHEYRMISLLMNCHIVLTFLD